jgi:hypothetical protein
MVSGGHFEWSSISKKYAAAIGNHDEIDKSAIVKFFRLINIKFTEITAQ